MRKLILGLAGAAALVGGIATATAPAEAKVHVFFGFGTPGYYDPYYDPYYYDPYYDNGPLFSRHHHRHHPVRCKIVKRWHHHHWVWVKKCYRVYH